MVHNLQNNLAVQNNRRLNKEIKITREHRYEKDNRVYKRWLSANTQDGNLGGNRPA
ncbi:hypothetical protein HanXRQr2_Chr09g0375391 [Helianthus annuus]|uniref:Uncharacterized protein n=1 Tax=Helianthus annuus TaxID=4232 RepID=A0A9K3I4J7_HELAN|nr:hypothetical protein HanXRQr2_Chr09g0375391 [Helianthus annuus]KAJ0892104.1 hypothetical protein HanPSC8_Chr09g0361891 [Helianthus annuus]